MPINATYVNKREASELGLPLRYGDVVGEKIFLHYLKNKVTDRIYKRFKAPSYRDTVKNKTKAKLVRIKQFCSRVKMFKGCAICGYKKHPAALHFNHIDPTKKVANVSKLRSWVKVKEEIRKCEVLCANCHAIKTVEEKHYLNEGNT